MVFNEDLLSGTDCEETPSTRDGKTRKRKEASIACDEDMPSEVSSCEKSTEMRKKTKKRAKSSAVFEEGHAERT